MRIVVGITGASGAIYGIRLVEILAELGIDTHLIISEWARKTIEIETNITAADVQKLARRHYEEFDLAAPISSGSF